METLDEGLERLHREYLRARKEADAGAKYLALEAPHRRCRYCGKFWIMWPGSRLDGHVRCAVTPTFMYLVRDFFRRHTTTTYAVVANKLDVGFGAVTAWWQEGHGS